jgi:hypothetical protein
LPERADIVDGTGRSQYERDVRAHSRRESESLAGSSSGRHAAGGRHHLLTPHGVLRLQRTAGNEAVSGALAVQRKHIGKEMMEFSNGTIEGMIDGKAVSIGVTDGWLAG